VRLNAQDTPRQAAAQGIIDGSPDMQRRTFTTGALALAAAAVTTVPRGAAQAQEKVTLSFLHKFPEPNYIGYFEDVVKRFEAQNPNVSIKMEAVADDPYKSKIRVVMASGNVPDIFFSWSGEYAAQFVRAGRALDLTSALSGDGWKDRFTPAMLEPFRSGGKLYGVPMNQSAALFAYNKAHFAKVGASEPKTWTEFLDVCEKLKAGGITPIALGSQAPWTTAHYLGDLNAKLVPAALREADYSLSATPNALFRDPGYEQALTHFQELMQKGYFNRSPNAMTMAMVRGSFASGREGMLLTEIVQLAPMMKAKIGEMGLGVFKIPVIEGARGDQQAITGAPDGFLVGSSTKYPKEALAFLQFLTTPENGAAYTKATGRTSAVNGAVTADNAVPEALRGVEMIREASAMSLWLDTVVEARVANAYLSGGQALLGGSGTPAQVMDKVRAAAAEAKRERS
jgi:raffinose/stachyose/melibiose transport system substrate-binding protein